jgi:hypothetical protein
MIVVNLNNKNEMIDTSLIGKYEQKIEETKGEVNGRSFKNWGIYSGGPEELSVPTLHLSHVVLLLNVIIISVC